MKTAYPDYKKISYQDFKKESRILMFGHEDAIKEDEDRLSQYYFKTTEYEDIISGLPFQIIIGEKGTGKSALLKMAYYEDKNNGDASIWIRIDDLSEIYEEVLDETNLVKLKTLWKRAISKLVVSTFAGEWKMAIGEDAEIAINWAYETGYKSRDFISKSAEYLKPFYEKYIKLNYCADHHEHRVFERMYKNVKIRLYFDDFDVDWNGTKNDVAKLKSLLLALGDLTSDIHGLSTRIALRTDVYEMIRNEEFSDKLESAIIKCNWNNQQIINALAKRICTYLGNDFHDKNTHDEVVKYLSCVFEERFVGTKVWNNAPIHRVIYSLIRRKPRDMVKLCHSTAEIAYSRKLNKINSDCFISILEEYSIERMRDIVNEYKNQITDLESLLHKMGPTRSEIQDKRNNRYVYSTDELYNKIKNIMQNLTIRIYDSSQNDKICADFHDIAHFLYKIGFVTGRKVNGDKRIMRLYYDEAPTMLKRNIGDNGYSWEIHPAYRGAISKIIKDDWVSTVDVSNELT